MGIDRTFDGSYGTATLKYDNPYLMVFDEFDLEYESGNSLGLIEESTYMGWKRREFFVANSGLMPTQFNVAWENAKAGLSLASCLAILLALLFSQ